MYRFRRWRTAMYMQEVSHYILDSCQSANGFCFIYEAATLSLCPPSFTRGKMNIVLLLPLSSINYSRKPPLRKLQARKNTYTLLFKSKGRIFLILISPVYLFVMLYY
jgi:hypothetical protein